MVKHLTQWDRDRNFKWDRNLQQNGELIEVMFKCTDPDRCEEGRSST